MNSIEQKENFTSADILKIVRAFTITLMRQWYLLLLFCLIGVGLGIGYYHWQKPKYEAVCTFILEEKSGTGGLAGLASQFGFNLGSMGGGTSLFSGENILDILTSQKIIKNILLTRVDENNKQSAALVDRYLQFSGMAEKFRDDSSLVHLNYSDSIGLTPKEDSILNVIYKGIVQKNVSVNRISKQGTIIKVVVQSKDEQFARLLTERMVDGASKLYIFIKTGTAKSNIARMQHYSDSLLNLLNVKSYIVANAQPLDINPGLKSAAVPVEIATRNKTVIAALYTEVIKNLETSKIIVSQESPIIQILDKPGQLLEDKRIGLVSLILYFSIFTTFALIAYRFILFVYRQNKMVQ